MKAIPLPTLFAGDLWQRWRHPSDQGTCWPSDTRTSSCLCLCHNFCSGHPDCRHTRHDQELGRISTGHPTRLSSKAGCTRLCKDSRRSTAQEEPPTLPEARPEQQDQSIACGGQGSGKEGLRTELVTYHSLSLPSFRPAWRDKRNTAWDLSRHSLHSS